MLHVVTQSNKHLYASHLAEMHRQRTELFKHRRRWNLVVDEDGGERDEGDDARAVYLLAFDPFGHCSSSIRLRPADDFSYLIDHMPEWVEGDAQALRQDPGLWEIARWINKNGHRTRQEIRIGMIECMLARGATQAVSCPDLRMAKHALATGWSFRPIGSPRRYPEGGIAVAISQPVSPEVVQRMRDFFKRRDFFLIEVPADAPWAHLSLPVIERAYDMAAETAISQEELDSSADRMLREVVNGVQAI